MHITIDNLRRVVQLAANAATARPYRRYNSLPGSVWAEPPGGGDPVLTNGDEIMPNNYTLTHMSRDLRALQSLTDSTKTRLKDHFTTVAYSSSGKLGLLVSHQHGVERITKIDTVGETERVQDEDVNDQDNDENDHGVPILPPPIYRAPSPIRSAEARWTLLRPIKGSPVGLGVLAFCGEIPQEDHSDNAAVRREVEKKVS